MRCQRTCCLLSTAALLTALSQGACGQAPAAAPSYARTWQQETVYQIYPRSFADSDGDGMGDLRGIIGKLDYIKNLGIDAVWLSPVYKSTHYDNGYDVSDYLDVDPLFGTLADWHELLDGLHQRHIKLIMDLVVNHSSDEHPWFIQEVRYKTLHRQLAAFTPSMGESPATFAATMRQVITRHTDPTQWPPGPYAGAAAAVQAFRSASSQAEQMGYTSTQLLLERLAVALHGSPQERAELPSNSDFYIWRAQPSNWRSCFDGPAWHHQAEADAHYLALFSPHQPDFNWTNPHLRAAIEAMVRVWVARGIDGLRLDVIDLIAKDMDFPTVATSAGLPYGPADAFFTNLPVTHDYLQELVDNALNPNLRTVGELAGVSPEESLAYTDPNRHELKEAFLFGHMEASFEGPKYALHTFSMPKFRAALTAQQSAVHGRGWLANYLENHDRQRAVSSLADDGAYRDLSAKMLGTLLFTLEGTPYVYQGQELGMTNSTFTDIDEVQDLEAINYFNLQQAAGQDLRTTMDVISHNTRDNARTAMQWDDSPAAGFTTGEPWLKVNPNYPAINAAKALQDPRSTLAFYRRLIQMRRHNDVLLYGAYKPQLPDHPHVFAYTRELGHDRVWVLLNFSGAPQAAEWSIAPDARLLLGTYGDEVASPTAPLRPYEGRVYAL